MALFDLYFSHLQSFTGAEQFVLVRDDAHAWPRGAWKRRRAPRSASLPSSFGSSPKSRPEFEESEIQNPPRPPLRMESQDDLCTTIKTEKYHSRTTGKPQCDSMNRFKTLLGSEVAAHINAKRGLMQEARSFDNHKAQENLTGPKFPIRKDSNNDLRAPRFSTHGPSLLIDSMINKKLELSHFLDEVTHVLDPSKDLGQCT